ncbi:DUF4124 domain-containing protein [Marinobacter fonticola]|uniref:DUF4124 domain-containing protein n=1 Tax=Marinobacter fonticola TaxID=2603215 RepID=UPI0011E67D9D|nr:DUF4124 domain-containing protein [Marinobacter fonticola]
MTRFLALLGVVVFASTAAQAEVYKRVDAQGNVTYSDEPLSGGQAIKVEPVTTVTLPKADQVREIVERGGEGEEQQSSQRYGSVTFMAPEDESAFHSGSGDITFSVSSQPALRSGHLFEVTLDGQPIGQNASGRFSVNNVFRGTHKASVNIVDSQGRIIQPGQNISFTIHRPSVLN